MGGGGGSLVIHFQPFLIDLFYFACKIYLIFLGNRLLFILLNSVNFAQIKLILILSNV